MAPWLTKTLEFARKMFARESLPEPPPGERPRPRGGRLVDLVLSREELSLDPIQEPSRRQSLFDVVFGSEELPLDAIPAPPRPRSGFSSLFVGRETLPEDPSGAPRHRSRWLALLFRPERLDPS